MKRHLYTLLLWLLLPYILFHLLWRGRKQPAYLQHVGERFGFYPTKPSAPLIWLHAVSVGETRAAVPLIRLLQQRYPRHKILLSHMTPTGRETGELLFGGSVLRCYLPYDYPFAIRAFLAHYRPTIGLLMETEIWFNLIHGCQQSGVPLLLVNGRMSEKSARKYHRFAGLTQESLHALAAVAAQTETDARRLTALGAPAVEITGNLKFDIEPPPAAAELAQKLRSLFGESRPVFLAASTREGEEVLLLDALAKAAIPDLLTVIVPRHPQRFDQVAALLAQRGLRFQRRSAGEPVAKETQVVLGDSMGELFAYYQASDLAFIGGSLLPFGGQNLIEAASVGTPVLIGPHTYNFEEAARLALESGAALRVQETNELVGEVKILLQDRSRLVAMGQAGIDFAKRHQGAAQKTMSLLEPLLQG